MEDKKLTNPGFEKLNDEDLRVVSGGVDNGVAIPSLPRNNSNLEICTVCGKLKRIEYYYHEKRICGACLENYK